MGYVCFIMCTDTIFQAEIYHKNSSFVIKCIFVKTRSCQDVGWRKESEAKPGGIIVQRPLTVFASSFCLILEPGKKVGVGDFKLRKENSLKYRRLRSWILVT